MYGSKPTGPLIPPDGWDPHMGISITAELQWLQEMFRADRYGILVETNKFLG